MLTSSWLRSALKIVTGITLCIAAMMAAGVFVFVHYGRDLPKHDHLRDFEPLMMSRLYTSDAQLLKEYATEKRLFVPFHQIPQLIKNAFMAAEDRNFYYHFGVDIVGTARAVLVNTLTNSWGSRPSGASTITQQVAKNFLVGNERSMDRKIKEAILALRLEYTLPKDRIFELYLNQIYMGAGTYGVAAAALVYFDKELHELTIDEVAFLAALPKAPTTLTKGEDVTRAKARRDWVIDRMLQEDMIGLDEAEEAKSQPLSFQRHREIPVKADYFTDAVHRELRTHIDPKIQEQGGVTVRTTMNVDLQTLAESSLRMGLLAYDRRHGWRGAHAKVTEEGDLKDWTSSLKKLGKPVGSGDWDQVVVLEIDAQRAYLGFMDGTKGQIHLSDCDWAAPCLTGQKLGKPPTRISEIVKKGDVILVSKIEGDRFRLEQIPNVTGALVAMDPKTGRILALVGGYDFDMNQYNCALQAQRQTGSCFKPFVYLVGLENGMTAETKILDAPISISLGRRGYYSPQNYTRNYLGLCSMRVGLEQSRNVMTIRLAQRVGMTKIIECAKQFGIMDRMPRQLAMVLGAGETSVVKLTAAYAALANGGKRVIPHTVDWIQDRYGETLYQYDLKVDPMILANPQSVAQLTEMLVGVTQRGTAKSLASLGFVVAGKTGSTNNYNDAWFMGYTPDLVVGVFVGFAKPRSLGEHETGGRVATPIFRNFIEGVYKDRAKPIFQITTPQTISNVPVVDDDVYLIEEESSMGNPETSLNSDDIQEITDVIEG